MTPVTGKTATLLIDSQSSSNSQIGSWTRLGLLGIVAAALYAPVFPPMVREWREFPSLSHGFAIPVIAGFLIWTGREHLRSLTLTPSFLGFPLLLLSLLMLVFGAQGGEPFFSRVSFPLTLLGLVILIGGMPLFKQLWYGIGYLVFMVPLPYSTLKLVTYRSRILDATASAQALGWLGVPVFQEGVWLHLPNITLEVADECSSIPALAAMIALGAAYAFATQTRISRRAILILASIPLGVISNIIRITATAWGTYYIGPAVLQSTFHKFTGTTNFLLTVFFLLLLDKGLSACSRNDR